MKGVLRPRKSLVAILAVALWLGTWGMERILAGRLEPSLDPSPALTGACEDELRQRLPPGPAVHIAGDYRVQSLETTGMRLVSRYERRGSGATPFACDLQARNGDWEVTEITVVHW